MARTFDFLHATNDVLRARGVALPLEGQRTTTAQTRFAKGVEAQKRIFGERITVMRAQAPRDQGHLHDYLAAQAHQRTVDEALHRFRIHALGNRRVSRQVGEQDRDLAALLGQALTRGRRPGAELAPAVHAEVRLRRCGGAASFAAAIEAGAAGHAKACARRVFRTAGRAAHAARLEPGAVRRM